MNRRIYSTLSVMVLSTASSLLAQEAPRARSANSHRMIVRTSGGSYLGIGVAEVDAERAKALNLKEVRGVEVKSVDEDSPAAKAGLKENDVVLEYNGQRIEGTEQFVRLVRETPVDRQVHLLVWRNGGTQTLTGTIGRRPGATVFRGDDGEDFTVEIPAMPPMPPMPSMPPMPEIAPVPDFPHAMNSGRSGMLGIEGEAVSSQLADFFGVKEGVLVRSVTKNSAAEKAGIRAGDVIVKVDGEAVASPREITSVLRAAMRGKRTLPIVVVRDKKETTLNVTLESNGMRGIRPVVASRLAC